jgi:hypothetical protein
MTDLIERLRAEVRQRQYESGDMLYLGAPDPLLTEAADEIAALRARVAELEGLIRECRLADAYAARTGDESRWDRAFHELCWAEKPS